MKTEDFISKLTEDVSPVKRLPSLLKRSANWVLFTFVTLVAGITVVGIRSDIEVAFYNQYFFFQFLLLVALAIGSAISALSINTPGEIRKSVYLIPCATLMVWGFTLIVSAVTAKTTNTQLDMSCFVDITLLGMLPGVFLFYMLRKGFPLKIGLSSILGALSVAAVGALGTHFICPNDEAFHVLLTHFVPVVFLSFVGFGIGRKILHNGCDESFNSSFQ